jgi:hypothetical protein
MPLYEYFGLTVHGYVLMPNHYHLAKHQDVPRLPAAPVCCLNRELRLIS